MSSLPVPERKTVFALAVSLVLTGFVIVIVNILIYRARILFIAGHPEYVAKQPPTISRAISDPLIGEPFAMWMAICAPLLWIGVACLVWAGWAENGRQGGISQADRRAILWLSGLLLLVQAAASLGMVLLSHFRFPDHRDMHMFGSYLFFFSQVIAIVVGEVLSRRYESLPKPNPIFTPIMARIRRWYVWVPIFLGFAYLALFILKDFDLGAINKGLYQCYVLTEPLLISSFLCYILVYHGDMWSAIRRYRRA
ncbi:hypothetical protein [Shimia sp. SDUM112013]|uniref:hypothetical protein n=1 Tax=Shimia sp. SDUM112013 TaxID=3136160 RepID=UPI0032EC4AE0